MDIGQRIREGRRKAGLTQKVLAERMGVAPSAVAQWETDIHKPTLDNRVDLAAMLRIPFAELLPEAGAVLEVALRDPQTVALVRHFVALPSPVREAILMQVVATAESLSAAPRDPAAKK